MDELKNGKPGKKGVQALRNKITAQLSRDRMKMEVEFLREQCSRYQRLLRLMHEKVVEKDFCDSCQPEVEMILNEHENKGVLIQHTRSSHSANKRQKVSESREKQVTIDVEQTEEKTCKS